MNWNLHASKKDKIKAVTDLWEIPILDNENKVKEVETEEDKAANFEYFKRTIAKYS